MAIAGGRGRGRGSGGERCSTAGCANKAQSSGKCRTHTGLLGQCSHEGCEKQAQYKGLCVAHGGRRICTHPDCNKTVTSKGKCGDHGGGRRRSQAGRRPRTQDTSSSSGRDKNSMMSLLLNEWPQDAATYRDSGPIVLPQQNCSTHPIWTGGDQDRDKLSSLVSVAAAVMPATSYPEQSNGSMMSLLMEGWPGAAAAKMEEESSAVGTADSNAVSTRNPRKRALCTYDDCGKIAQSQGLCVSHGGKRCIYSECTKSAQYQGLCTTHGGSRACTFPGCTKTVRSNGRCFEHGGGKHCALSECTKPAQANGLCSIHAKARYPSGVVEDVLV